MVCRGALDCFRTCTRGPLLHWCIHVLSPPAAQGRTLTRVTWRAAQEFCLARRVPRQKETRDANPSPAVIALRGASDSDMKTKSVRGMAADVIFCEHVLGQ